MMARRSWLLPSPADLIFLLVIAVAVIIRGQLAVSADGDLARHLRVGGEILSHGLFFTDRFSWTMQGQPFVPYEWGSELLYALAQRLAGLPGVIALMGLTVAIAYALACRLLVRFSTDPLVAFVTTLFAAAAGSFYWLARPHVFSLVFVVGVMWMLEAGSVSLRGGSGGPDEAIGSPVNRRSRPKSRVPRPAWVFLLFALWANLHAGFLYGLVLIGCYVIGDLLTRSTALRHHALMLVAALAGTLINPVGPGLIPYVAGFFRKTFLVDITAEMQSPDFHSVPGRVFLLLLVLCLVVLARNGRRLPVQHLLVFLATTAFALQSGRHIQLWALTGFVVIALNVERRTTFGALAGAARGEAWSLAAALGLIVIALHGGRLGATRVIANAFDPRALPVAVVQRARTADLTGRMFNDFVYGGYILYAWPEQRVFIDGQSDFYEVPLNRLYMSIRQAHPGWQRRLDSLGVSMVLVPADAPLAWRLADAPQWTLADSADGAVRYARR